MEGPPALLAHIERRLRRVRLWIVGLLLIEAVPIYLTLLGSPGAQDPRVWWLIAFFVLPIVLIPMWEWSLRGTMASLRPFGPRLRDAAMDYTRGIVLVLDDGVVIQIFGRSVTTHLFFAPSGATVTPRVDQFRAWTGFRKLRRVSVVTEWSGPPRLQAVLREFQARLGPVGIFAVVARTRAAYPRSAEPSLAIAVVFTRPFSIVPGERVAHEVDTLHAFMIDLAQTLGGVPSAQGAPR
jgi:hypothetical protein